MAPWRGTRKRAWYPPAWGRSAPALELSARLAQPPIADLGFTQVGIAYAADTRGAPCREGAVAMTEEARLEPAGVVEYSAGAPDASSQAAQLKAAGAEIVLVNHV